MLKVVLRVVLIWQSVLNFLWMRWRLLMHTQSKIMLKCSKRLFKRRLIWMECKKLRMTRYAEMTRISLRHLNSAWLQQLAGAAESTESACYLLVLKQLKKWSRSLCLDLLRSAKAVKKLTKGRNKNKTINSELNNSFNFDFLSGSLVVPFTDLIVFLKGLRVKFSLAKLTLLTVITMWW